MTLTVLIPGLDDLRLEHLLLDINGTLTDRGRLLAGIEQRIDQLRAMVEIRLVSADTFGTLEQLAERLRAKWVRAASGEDKLRLLEQLGRDRCVVVGNGANDALVLQAAALGIAIVGPEGASVAALQAADVACTTAAAGLDLLLEPRALSATLRP
jgi:P-type E1-E2 ATPase